MTAPERQGCPSCDRDLSYPGAPGHECYTYAEHAARIKANEAKAQSLSAIESLLRTNSRVMRERDDARDDLRQERIGRQQATDELMRLKDHDSHDTVTAPEPVVLTDGERMALHEGMSASFLPSSVFDAVEQIVADRLAADRAAREALLAEDRRTHGLNHAPLLDGEWLAPGFCAGCDNERRAATTPPESAATEGER